jgi:hypothetical protein
MWVWGFWDRVVAVTAVGAGLPTHETSEAWPEPVTPPFEFLIAFFSSWGVPNPTQNEWGPHNQNKIQCSVRFNN